MTRAILILTMTAPLIFTLGCSKDSIAPLFANAAAAAPVQPKQSPVKRGEYLVTAIGCGDCHTPHLLGPHGLEQDMTRYLSGHPEQIGSLGEVPKLKAPWMWAATGTNTAFAGPWGISYAMNLTPDKNTGLGIWTEDIFVKTIRTGKHWGTSRPIAPPMPWPAFRNLSDEDLKAIYAYLRTIKPITNHVPDYEPPANQN